MRLFLQVISLLGIVILGWNQPYRDTAAKLLPWMGIEPSHLAVLRAKSLGGLPPTVPDGPAPMPVATPKPPPATPPPFESNSPLNLRPKK